MKQQGGIRLNLYRGNALRVMGETRLNLFRVEYDEEEGDGDHVKGKLRFWYVGCVHDLTRPSGGMSPSFFKYAENFMHVVKEEKEEAEEDQKKANSPFLTRSRARALHETRTKLEMDEVVDDFVPEYEDEASGKKERVVRKRRGHAADEEDVVVPKKVK